MSAGTAQKLVTKSLRLLTVLDAEEQPTTTQINNGVSVLNDLMQHDFGDVLSSFQTERIEYTAKSGAASFTVGEGKDVPGDIRKIHTIWNGHAGSTQYELNERDETHLFAVGVTGPTPVRFMSEMRIDGSLRVILWPTPSSDVPLLISVGYRVAQIEKAEDLVLVPPDAAYSLTYILAQRLRPEFGIPVSDVSDVMDVAETKEAQWKAHSVKNRSVRLRRRRR